MEKLPIAKKDLYKFLILFVILAAAWVLIDLFDLRDFIGSIPERSHNISTVLIFISIYIVLIISLLPSAPLNILAGAVFGPLIGTFYSWVAVVVGGAISFILARKFGEPLVSRIIEEKSEKLEKLNQKLEADSWEIVLLFRIIPFFPISGFNYLFGLSKMRLRSYLIGSLIGTIPGIFILSFFGDSLKDLNSWRIVGIIFLFTLVGLVSYIYKKRGNKSMDL